MRLTNNQAIVILFCVAIGTAITRFLPFLLFPENREQPPVISYLSTTIPAAMMGLLVVYCLRNTELLTWPHGLPELIAAGVTAALHLWKRNLILSIAVGTALYMLLVQLIFV